MAVSVRASSCLTIMGLSDSLRQERFLRMKLFVHVTHYREGRCHVSPALISLAMPYLG